MTDIRIDDFPCFIISFEGSPRKKNMIEQLASTPITNYRFIDGEQFNDYGQVLEWAAGLSPEWLELARACSDKWRLATWSCLSSHVEAWQKTDNWSLIIEDDALFTAHDPDISEYMDVDYISIDYSSDTGSVGQIISAKGCRTLLENLPHALMNTKKLRKGPEFEMLDHCIKGGRVAGLTFTQIKPALVTHLRSAKESIRMA